MKSNKSGIFLEIETIIASLNPDTIPEGRKAVLRQLTDFIQFKASNNQEVRINFICTHNSRRSHLSQVWAQTLAHYFAINRVTCYSAGTEATALFPMVVEILENSGFQIEIISEGKNPIYSIKFTDNEHPIVGFSKKLDDSFNPRSGFVAVMTCDSANEACPIVPGAEKRVPITFEDPKVFDNTTQQAQKYWEKNLQIATELYYVFSQVCL